ncbi:hypothetical protein EHS25_008065 [Saitozyma podzolica]|uniref:FAD/NAD(P)-binding domain-containing protein n=1 Tax=Saitozyma podzolica TaxID=1890683 RepID=A0A427YNJ5_9TREE|nr:hypothetical protein EHS25_008065 [Saitozyma podzolica]
MSEYQNIVVIGASQAGHSLVNALAPNLPTTHRILLVDALDFAFWPIASLRAAVVPGWEKRVTAPLNTSTVFDAGSAHQVIAPNKVVELRESSIVLEKPFEGSTELPFFRCVIATGASQPAPMRPAEGATEESYRAELVKSQEEIAKATKVVVIGSGAVGVEMAGEIKSAHPSKSITIVSASPHVLNPGPVEPAKDKDSWVSPTVLPKLSSALEAAIPALGIDLILNERVVVPSSGAAVAEGEKDRRGGLCVCVDWKQAELGNRAEGGPRSGEGGLVVVDEFLRVRSDKLKNYYAVGDVSNTPGWKTVQGAKYDGEGAAPNIVADVKGQSGKKYVRPTAHGMIIPLGPKEVRGHLTLPVVGTWMLPNAMGKAVKGTKLFVEDSWLPRFKGAEKVAVPAPA